tara:strand:+ start:323 stop:691 length:369 start_codon:yes stop_codon:yes gene_type:complete
MISPVSYRIGKEINIDDIELKLYKDDAFFNSKIEDSHLWKVLNGNDADYIDYYKGWYWWALVERDIKRFKELAINFKYLEGDFKNSYITLEKDGDKYLTIDGDHRVTILKYMGVKKILCEII